MFIFVFSSLVFAEEVSTVETTPVNEKTYTLLYSGTDPEASTVRTSLAADIDAEQLQLQTIVDVTRTATPTYLSQKDSAEKVEQLDGCTGSTITNKHIQNYTQTADNHLSYYELEKAAADLNKAETSLVCLQELFNADDVRQMYYLKGILEQTQGNDDASQQSFSSAIRIKPDIQWNNFYSPDAKPNFDAAKSEFSSLGSIALDIIPSEAASSLWINGTPLLDVNSPTIYSGTNIIQIVGLETTTYEISVPSDVDSIKLVLPSTLPNTAFTWVEDTEKVSELSSVLNTVIDPSSTVYVHNAGRVWSNDIGTSTWTELEVPKFAETRLNARKITGQTLFWSGLATGAISIGLSANYYIQGQQSYRASADTNEWDQFVDHRADLTSLESRYQTSMLTTLGGLGLAGLGYAIAF